MQLLDTSTVAPEHRVAAFRAAFDQASVPCRIEHLGPDERVQSRMHLWHFGAANLFTTDASGFRLVRTPRHLRLESPPVVALAVQSGGVGRFGQFGVQAEVPAGQLMLSDLTAPYDFSWEDTGGSRAFQVPYGLLALPPDVVREAAPRLRCSPLHGLVRDHLVRMSSSAEQLAADPGAASLGSATVELVRALLVSAAADSRYLRAVREETLLVRLLAYARAHLTEPDLGPGRLAAAHNISLRQLYKVGAEADVHLEQSHRRAAGARPRRAGVPGRAQPPGRGRGAQLRVQRPQPLRPPVPAGLRHDAAGVAAGVVRPGDGAALSRMTSRGPRAAGWRARWR